MSVKKDHVLKRAQYSVFELLSKIFGVCDSYVETRIESEQFELPEVIDYSNRMAEAKFALDAKSEKRMVKTSYIDCVAAMNEDGTKMAVSLINKNLDKDYEVELSVLGSDPAWNQALCFQIYHPDFNASNTSEEPENVIVKAVKDILQAGKIHLDRHSITVFTVGLEKKYND